MHLSGSQFNEGNLTEIVDRIVSRLYVNIWIQHVVISCRYILAYHDDVIKWKHFPRYWPFVRGIHRSPVNSQQKGKWRGALMFSLICSWINGWVNNRKAGDLRRNRAHYDVSVMSNYVDVEVNVNVHMFIISAKTINNSIVLTNCTHEYVAVILVNVQARWSELYRGRGRYFEMKFTYLIS